VRAALDHTDALDGRAAARARMTCFPENPQVVLVLPFFAVRRAIIAQRRASMGHRLAQDLPDGIVKEVNLLIA
jgi:hypothetical protein